MSVSLRQLRYFAAAAEAGTIAGGAASARVSQSAIALAIGDLERALGVQLFLRHRAKGLTLTQAGTSVLADARSLLAHADELVNSARSMGQELSGSLAIGCYTTLAPFLLPAALEGFAAEHPTVQLSFSEGSQVDLQNRLASGVVEVALLYDLDLQPGIHTEVLYRTRPHVLLPQNHPLATGSPVDLRRLSGEPMIMLDYPPSRHYFTELLTSADIKPNIRHTTASFETVRSLVARGLGYSLLIQRPTAGVSYEGLRIAHCEIAQAIPDMPVLIAWPSGGKLTRRARAFTEFCHQLFRAGPADAPPM